MTRTTSNTAMAGMALAFWAMPVAADSLDDWLSGDYATGSWGGVRTQLEDAGVTFEGVYTTDMMAVRNGNAGNGDGWDYAGRIDFGVEVDFEKLAGIRGFSAYASGAWSSGRDLSERKVGNVFAVQQIFTGEEVRLSQLYVQQRLFEDMLTVKVGRLTTEADFLASDIYANYVNGGINGVPSNIPDSNFGYTTAPFAQWGVVVAAEPLEHLRIAVGIYNADEKTVDDTRHGTDFALNPGNGVFAVGELSYAWNQPEEPGAGSGPKPAVGLPGLAKVGVFGETGDREDLKDGSEKSGNPGFYLSVEQMVYREADSFDDGLTVWAVGAFLPRQSINEVPSFFGTGLVYKGLIPGRSDDSTAVGFLYGKFSNDLDPIGSEKVLEINHTVSFAPWFYVRPALQLVFDPAGDKSAATAVVFGGEIGIVF